MRAEGRKETDVAAATGVSMATVSLWSKRFEEKGLDGLVDLPGRGRKPWLDPRKVRRVVSEVTRPPRGSQRWSTRTGCRLQLVIFITRGGPAPPAN